MQRTIESHIYIEALSADIWRVFADFASWGDWWANCRRVELDGDSIVQGAKLTSHISGLPAATRNLTIKELRQGRFMAGIGRRSGITVKQSFSFVPNGDGSQAIIRMEMMGLALIPLLLFGRMRRIKLVLDDGLLGLKRIVERTVTCSKEDVG